MALQISNATRRGPVGCNHYRITVSIDGQSETVDIALEQLESLLDDVRSTLPGISAAAFVAICWASYKRKKGASIASLLNVDIA